MKESLRRVALNFAAGYCVCSALVGLSPMPPQPVSVTVFHSEDGVLTTTESYRYDAQLPFNMDNNNH
jgi:hypothetical protein